MRQSTIDMILKWTEAGCSPEETAHLLKQPIALVKAVIETANDKVPDFWETNENTPNPYESDYEDHGRHDTARKEASE